MNSLNFSTSTSSGEEVSVSLGYALGLRQTRHPPSVHPQGTSHEKSKTKWVPKKVNSGKWARDNDKKGNPKCDQEWGSDGPHVQLTKIGRDETTKTTKKLTAGTG